MHLFPQRGVQVMYLLVSPSFAALSEAIYTPHTPVELLIGQQIRLCLHCVPQLFPHSHHI